MQLSVKSRQPLSKSEKCGRRDGLGATAASRYFLQNSRADHTVTRNQPFPTGRPGASGVEMNQVNQWCIRACCPEEANALLELWRQAEATPSVTDTVADVERMISTGTVLVAEADGQLVGSIFGVFDGWRANIYRLAVHPSYRRRGIARALVGEVEQRLVRQ